MNSYKEHYKQCLKNSKVPQSEQGGFDLYELDLIPQFLTCEEEYKKLILTISQKLNDQFSSLNEDIIEEYNCLRLASYKGIPEILDLVRYVERQVEQKVFHTKVKTEHIHTYRNIFKEDSKTSWVWHYDNCPNEIIKLAIYLNDVTAQSAPMEVLTNEYGYLKYSTSALAHDSDRKTTKMFNNGRSSRIPEEVIADLQERKEYQVTQLVGQRGFNFLFNANIAHRATIPNLGQYRDAIFLYLRPAISKPRRL